MRLLFIDWNTIGNDFIIKEFKTQGIDVIKYHFNPGNIDLRYDGSASTMIAQAILQNQTELVFSFNYIPIVAIAANACKSTYISWTYDSPYINLYSKTISLPTNIAFVFDRDEAEKLNKLGANNVFYLPMCAPVDVYDQMIPTKEHHKLYGSKISMIGGMYSEEKHNLLERYINNNEYVNGFLEGLIRCQQQLYGVSILESCLTPDISKSIQEECKISLHGDSYESIEWIIANYIIARKLTSYERFEYLQLAGDNFDNVNLFTREVTPTLKTVTNNGPLDYYNHMPYAMKCSEINLNISLRSIVNAIPLRIFDIMGCGGFCLTNYQGEMLDYFIPGEDFDYFESKTSFIDKCKYYLKNDSERIDIAKNGYKKIKKHHTYKQRVETILETIG